MSGVGCWQEGYLKRFYHNQPGWVNGTAEFHTLIRRHLLASPRVLELGPGPTNATSEFLRRTYLSVHGLDVDEEARRNKDLEQVYIYDGGGWPIPDGDYDAVVADFVLEHLPWPERTVAEAYRALRP